YRNEGNGRFTDVSADSGVAGEDVWSTSATFFDYNRDGLLDIYIVNYLKFRKGKRTFEAQQGFETASSNFNATLFDSEPNRLYQNLGGFRFKDITEKARVDNISGRGLAALSLDYNNDGFSDLIVSNDSGFPNAVFKNLRDGTFADVTESLNLHGITATSTVASGDIDNNGDNELFFGTLEGDSNLLYTGFSNSGRYVETAHAHGIGGSEWNHFSTFGALVQDLNNDGRLDYFAANGLTIPDPDNPRAPLGQPNLIWINHDGHFGEPLILEDRLSSRAAVTADFDNDGDLDIFIANNNDLGQLLINAASGDNRRGHWVNLKLVGRSSNRDGYGSKLWLTTDHGTQYREWQHPAGFLANNDNRLHFGLGESESINTLKVQWPNGDTSIYRGLAADNFYLIKEGDKQVQIMEPPPLPGQHHISADTFTATHALYELLLEQNIQDSWAFDIAETYRHAGEQEKHTLLELFSRRNTLPGLQLLTMALDEPSPSLRELAVEKLQQREDPISNRWLLRAFHDPAPRVRCAVARAYEHFFREEEAMVQRKYTALRYLLKLLDDPDTEVQLCAILALQEAEHYRSIGGLLSKIRNNSQPLPAEVVNQSIRALGLIREGEAIDPLLELYNRPETQNSTRAYILIALKRLNYKRLDTMYNELTRLSVKGMQETANKLDILKHIVEQPLDSTVFEPGHVAQATGQWLIKAVKRKAQDKQTIEGLTSAIRILTVTQNADYMTSLHALLQHDNSIVRAAAYEAVSTLNPNSLNDSSARIIRDMSPDVQQSLFKNLNKRRICPPAPLILEYIDRIDSVENKIGLLACHADNMKVQHVLLNIANDQSIPIDLQNRALSILSHLKQHALKIPASFFKAADAADAHRKALLITIRSNHEETMSATAPVDFLAVKPAEPKEVNLVRLDIIGRNHYPWAKAYLEDVIKNQELELSLRAAALDTLCRQNSLETSKTLFTIAREFNGEVKLQAIKALRNHKTAPITKWLQDLAKNPKEPADTRIMAAYALFPEVRAPLISMTNK
ncbi:MAG TPA: FG-GAP-like repeat-containing protein, partial [Gammaproteobacteria bacterium]